MTDQETPKPGLHTTLYVEKSEDPQLVKARIRIDRQVWAALVLMGVVQILFLVGFIFLFKSQSNIVDTQLTNREQGYKNAAKSCSISIALRVPVTDDCNTEDVLKYYKPTEIPLSARAA